MRWASPTLHPHTEVVYLEPTVVTVLLGTRLEANCCSRSVHGSVLMTFFVFWWFLKTGWLRG